MSVSTELTALNNNLLSAYTKIFEKGGTVPANKNTANLANAINSISVGSDANAYYFSVNNPAGSSSITIPFTHYDSTKYCYIFAYASTTPSPTDGNVNTLKIYTGPNSNRIYGAVIYGESNALIEDILSSAESGWTFTNNNNQSITITYPSNRKMDYWHSFFIYVP